MQSLLSYKVGIMKEKKPKNSISFNQWQKLINKSRRKADAKRNIFFCVLDEKDGILFGDVIIFDYVFNEKNKKAEWGWNVYNNFPFDGTGKNVISNYITDSDIKKLNLNNKVNSTVAFHEEILGLFFSIEDYVPPIARKLKIKYWESLQPSCLKMELKDLDKNNVCGELIRKFILSHKKNKAQE